MNKRSAPVITLVVSLILLAQLIGGIGCPVGKSESGYLSETAREAVYAQIKWLDEQKFKAPDAAAPLNINLDSIESNTHRIGVDGGQSDVNMAVSMGVDIGAGGVGGGGGGGGG